MTERALYLESEGSGVKNVTDRVIADPMCSIFNQSIRSGIFPQEWKCAKVIPLFKEGNHSDLNNYRPISIVPIVAKVFERIIYERTFRHELSFSVPCSPVIFCRLLSG